MEMRVEWWELMYIYWGLEGSDDHDDTEGGLGFSTINYFKILRVWSAYICICQW